MNIFYDPNSSSSKSETMMTTPSDPNSICLPSRLCECKCEVVVVQDLLQCGVVQLEGANRKAYCLFFRKDFLTRNQGDQKLSTQVPVGTKLLANARLITERSVIPFLATSIWEVGATRRENELSKLFSSLEYHEIEQYNMLSRDLEWFLPRDDCLNNYVNKGFTDNVNESNNNSGRYYQGQSRNRSPDYRQKRSPGHHSRIRSRSRSPTHHLSQARSQTRSRSPRDYPGTAERFRPSRTRSRSPRDYPGTSERFPPSQTRSRSPRDYPGRIESKSKRYVQRQRDLKEFSEEKRIKNKIKNTELIKTEGAERFHPSRTRSRSPRNESITKRLMLLASTEGEVPPLEQTNKHPKYLRCQEQTMEESSFVKYKSNQEAKKRLDNEIENMGRIKIEAAEMNYQQQLKKSEHESEESLKLKWESKESASMSSSIIKEIGDLIVRHNCSKASNIIGEDKNEHETCGGEKYGATQDITTKVLNKKTGEMPKPTIKTKQPVSDRSSIENGKGKILKILDSNFGIAIVLGFGRLCRVLFDTYDVWIGSQVCADLGKTLFDVMQEGDYVCLHAICIENPPKPSTDQPIEYLATSVKRVSNIEALLKSKITAGGIPSTLEEVSEDKIKNFHEVANAVLAMQDEEAMVKSMGKDEIPIDIGILWKRNETATFVNFFCFHCEFEHCNANTKESNSKRTSWESHNKHMLNCTNLKCLENGEKKFQHMKEKDEVLQEKEFQRLTTSGNAGRSDSRTLYTCFHCQYEGKSMSHFTSKNHQDHVKDCGTKILDCPENPQVTSAANSLITSREMLCLPRGNMSSSYHHYFCLHCKEPFSDKRHVQGEKHTAHMARNSCVPACKFVMLDGGKYISGSGKGSGNWCFICGVKLVSSSNYQAHVKGPQHSLNVLSLLKKKVHNY